MPAGYSREIFAAETPWRREDRRKDGVNGCGSERAPAAGRVGLLFYATLNSILNP
jgi:hypothetical protein